MTTSILVMPFGKYKGTAITELKLSYVNWSYFWSEWLGA